jgi:fluoroacetyl-CoA thioesterase
MNHQGVSEICFAEVYTVPANQTARRLFATLPHGSHYAERLIEGMATGYLIAVVESICIREMQHHINHDLETVVGVAVNIEHCAPAPPGVELKICGWTEQIGERDAIFRVRIHDSHDIVCEGTLKLVAVLRSNIENRIARKVEESSTVPAA